jgi:divalent metal cation (Fe/Co/Zn/Cd) transporter
MGTIACPRVTLYLLSMLISLMILNKAGELSQLTVDSLIQQLDDRSVEADHSNASLSGLKFLEI